MGAKRALRAACWGLAVAAAAPAVATASLPEVTQIQAAYEAAYLATRGKPPAGEHADDLVIQSARCQPLSGIVGAACQIEFVRQREPEGRLYSDIVTLVPQIQGQGAWTLLSGLCMTRQPNKHAPGGSSSASSGGFPATTAR
ncbi:hypothetical protein AACH06_14920 [Ideonella sp. DXS29W]|uniref:Lipoprotein n=1 Tax=Ideonella lacteola TaxID=2984193 RepID=A0ABU9BTD3_9BURK